VERRASRPSSSAAAGRGRPALHEQRQILGGTVQQEVHHARSLGLSAALGAAMGTALGAATGHLGIWVAAGIAAYIAISLVGGAWSKRPDD
jgi:uncharacterized membrane protein YoaK (UPF0700 family)